MNIIKFFSISFLLVSFTFSELLPKAKKLKKIRTLYLEKPSKKLELKYIKTFPSDFKEFKSIFDPEDFSQLYDHSWVYVDLLIELYEKYPEVIGKKLIKLASTGKPGVDAVSSLTEGTIKHFVSDIKRFLKILSKYKEKEIDNIVSFIAAARNYHPIVFPTYHKLLKKLKELGEMKLYKKFEAMQYKEPEF